MTPRMLDHLSLSAFKAPPGSKGGPYDHTNYIECQPVESFLEIDALTCTASNATNLPNEKVNIVMDEGFLIAQGL